MQYATYTYAARPAYSESSVHPVGRVTEVIEYLVDMNRKSCAEADDGLQLSVCDVLEKFPVVGIV